MQRQEPADVVFDSDVDDVPPTSDEDIQIFTPPEQNPHADGQSTDDISVSASDRSWSYSQVPYRPPINDYREAWNVFADSSSDDELETGLEIADQQHSGAQFRTVLW